MDFVDFGKNTFLLELAFKLDVLSSSEILSLANTLVLQNSVFASMSKDIQTGDTLLTAGTGEPDSPLFQLRLKSDKLAIWAGWHTPFSRWKSVRDNTLNAVDANSTILRIPPTFLSQISSNIAIVIPHSHVTPGHLRQDLEPVLLWLTKFIPQELQARGAGFHVYSNKTNSRRIDFSHTGSDESAEDTISHTYRWLDFDASKSILTNIADHVTIGDGLFADFHEFYVKPGVTVPRVPLAAPR